MTPATAEARSVEVARSIPDALDNLRNRRARVTYLDSLLPWQRGVAEDDHRFRVLGVGRRAGKTWCLCGECRETARMGLPAALFVPSYKMLVDSWAELRNGTADIATRVSISERRIEVRGGGVIDCWSMDNADAARGRKYALVAIDEAAMVGGLDYAWEYVIRPTLIDYGGRALFGSTPKGRNFFWTLYRRGIEGDPDWRSWQLPTTVNPTIKNLDAEMEAARTGMPEMTYRQEVLAEFIDDSTVFRNVQAAIDKKVTSRPRVEGHRYVMGVDLARLEDFTVATVLDLTTSPREVVHVDRFNQVSWQAQRGRIATVVERYGIEVVYIDQTGVGDPVVEQLRHQVKVRLMHGVQFTNTNKSFMVEALMMAFERGELRLLDNPVMTAELLAYDAERLPSGALRYNAPKGQHDDCVVSLMLAWEAAGKQRTGRLVA